MSTIYTKTLGDFLATDKLPILSGDLSDAIEYVVSSELPHTMIYRPTSYDQIDGCDASAQTDLSIYTLPISAWMDFVSISADRLSGDLSNAMFLPQADYIEGYGRQLCNIVMDPNGDESLSTPDVAVTKIYADAISSYAKEISTSVSSWHDTEHIAIGSNSFTLSSKQANIAIGQGVSATNDYSIAIGTKSYNSLTAATTTAKGDRSIAIGPCARTSSTNSIALGKDTEVSSNSNGSIALGANAIISSGVSSTIQIYKNTSGVQKSDSLYFKNTQVVNSDGKIPISSIETGFAKSDDLTSYLSSSQISTYQTQVIDYSHPELSDEYHPTALSVIKVPVDVYADLLAGEGADTKYGIGDPNHVSAIPSALYVVENSEYQDAFGQEIKNVGYPTELSSAATKQYVDDMIKALSAQLFGEGGILKDLQQKY